LAGVFPGKEAVFDAVDVGQGVEATLRSAWHVLEAAWLQPAVADGVIRRLATQEPIDIGQGNDAGIGERFGHEVGVWFGLSNASLMEGQMGLDRPSDDEVERALLLCADLSERLHEVRFETNRDGCWPRCLGRLPG